MYVLPLFLYFFRFIVNFNGGENRDIARLIVKEGSFEHIMCVFFFGYLSGAIIPALMHRIPSELRS